MIQLVLRQAIRTELVQAFPELDPQLVERVQTGDALDLQGHPATLVHLHWTQPGSKGRAYSFFGQRASEPRVIASLLDATYEVGGMMAPELTLRAALLGLIRALYQLDQTASAAKVYELVEIIIGVTKTLFPNTRLLAVRLKLDTEGVVQYADDGEDTITLVESTAHPAPKLVQ